MNDIYFDDYENVGHLSFESFEEANWRDYIEEFLKKYPDFKNIGCECFQIPLPKGKYKVILYSKDDELIKHKTIDLEGNTNLKF